MNFPNTRPKYPPKTSATTARKIQKQRFGCVQNYDEFFFEFRSFFSLRPPAKARMFEGSCNLHQDNCDWAGGRAAAAQRSNIIAGQTRLRGPTESKLAMA